MKKIFFVIGSILLSFGIFSFVSAKTDIFFKTDSGLSGVLFSEKFGNSRNFIPKNNPFLAVESFAAPRPVHNSGIFGMEANEFLGKNPPDFSLDFSMEFELLKKIDSALAINPAQEMQSGDRAKKILNIEASLTSLEKESQKIMRQISVKKTHFEEEVNRWKQEYLASEKRYSDSFSAQNAEDATKNFEEIITHKQKYIAANENMKKSKSLEDQFSKRIPQIISRKSAIEKNGDALLVGVTVDAKTARSLGLVRD